ncbi:MAG: co-chaperone GroES [Candidatus Magasanikbacteria bacterium]
MDIKPLGDRVVLQLPEPEEKETESGIVLPDTVDEEEKSRGEVIATGPGRRLDNGDRAEMDVSEGDTVIFKEWGGEDVEIEGEEYKIVSEEDIVAILED